MLKRNAQHTMSNLVTRTIYGLIFAIIMIGSMIAGPKTLSILMGIVSIIGTTEILRLHKKMKLKRVDRFFVSLISLSAYLLIALTALEITPLRSLVLLIALLFFPFLHALFSRKHTFQEIAPLHWASFVFVALPSSLTLFFYLPEYVGDYAGTYLLPGVIAGIWINDIFAYLVGVKFGKHRLFERISPKKSWEGSIGGLIFTLVTAALVSIYTEKINLTDALALALIIVVSGSLGDLVESMLKRQANVKDSGKLIPGHGGILDRFDAAFMAIPFVFIYLIMNT